jgi:hypothetical protein
MSTSTHASPVDLSNNPTTMEQPAGPLVRVCYTIRWPSNISLTGLDEQLQKLEIKEIKSDAPSHEPELDEKQHETDLTEDHDDPAEPAAEDEDAEAQPAEETPAPEEKKEEEKPKVPEMQLRSTRKFKSVGSPAFNAVGAAGPRQPSRFVTIGKPEYKTIKASITSISDIYKASNMTPPEEKHEGANEGSDVDEHFEDAKEAMHETIPEEEDPTSPSAGSYRLSERDDEDVADEHDEEVSTHYEDATTARGSDDEGEVAYKTAPSVTPKEDDEYNTSAYSSDKAPPSYEKDPFSDEAQVADHKPTTYGDEKKPVAGDYAQPTSNVYQTAVAATGPDL